MSSIFLSHNSNDKPFVLKLANDLRRHGYYVWFDEADINSCEALESNISDILDRIQYIGVVISKNSIEAQLLMNKNNISVNQELVGRKIKVLPILLENVELPELLAYEAFYDFTEEDKYRSSLKSIMEKLDKIPAETKDTTLNSELAKSLKDSLRLLRKQLELTRGERRILIDRLCDEKKNISEELKIAIENEKGFLTELDDINDNYSFMCEGIAITSGYVLYGIQKEYARGGQHQIAVFCKMHNKQDELSLLVEAIVRRLNSINVK